MIKEKIIGEEFILEISLKKYDCNKDEIIEMLHNKIYELEEDKTNLKAKINELNANLKSKVCVEEEKENNNLKTIVNSTENLNVDEIEICISTSPNISFSPVNVQVKEKYYLSKFKRFISDGNSDTQYIPKSQWTFYENETAISMYKKSRYGVISYNNDYKIKIIVYDSNGPASDNYGWCYPANIPKNSFVCNLYHKPVDTRRYDTVLFYEDEEIAVGHIEYEVYSVNQGCTCCWSSRSLLNNCILINDLNV
ncbi:hypothetical protein U3516DRAFT_391373 [Neocallimastix sp. 'constans']